MNLYETVIALFCDPEGKVCCAGSDGDRAVLQSALDAHLSNTQPDALVEENKRLRAAAEKVNFYRHRAKNKRC